MGPGPHPPALTGATPAEAAQLIVSAVRPLPAELRTLRDALDLVTTDDIASPIDLPPWTNSAMDGFACRSADVHAGVVLRVVETIAAGQFPQHTLAAGEAARIFTGAPLPAGADGVIRQEDTEPDGDRVTIRDPRDAGRNIRLTGEDIRRGALVLPAGTPLGPAQLGVLASIAHEPVAVHRPPIVAFLGSGDEIVDLDRRQEILAGKKIATSNSYTLSGMIRRAGAVPREMGIARDTKGSLRDHIRRAAGSDLLVTTAGVSVGEHDLVREVLTDLGCDLRLWRVRMRPGAPLGFGVLPPPLGPLPWIGLPGNPVSTMVTFELFVRPIIRRLLGHARPFRRTVRVIVEDDITLGPRLRHFLRAIVEARPDGTLGARLTGAQGSGILTSMARADALLIVPEDRPHVPAGETLTAIVLDDPHHTAEPTF
ncbi:MAG TPA: gephyrin-like molybdotransferase Glp [Gemmatimonadales bacterium]|nr:gephyrin-like molybdotransferase Glp [Gemmatimonadales bacterium]